MAFYNRQKAVMWARTFAYGRSPVFADYSAAQGGGGDCTNFLSQNLFAGGWPMIPFRPMLWDSAQWWAQPPSRYNSKTWSSARWFIYFLEQSNRAFRCDLGDVIPGDVITHEGNGEHVMLVTKIESQPPQRFVYLTYHSTDRRDYSFSDVMNGFGSTGYKYWKLKEVFEADPT
jgi:hypothetical protein